MRSLPCGLVSCVVVWGTLPSARTCVVPSRRRRCRRRRRRRLENTSQRAVVVPCLSLLSGTLVPVPIGWMDLQYTSQFVLSWMDGWSL